MSAQVIDPSGQEEEVRKLAKAFDDGTSVRIRVNGEEVLLKGAALKAVRALLEALSSGSVTVQSLKKELSTQDTAELLNVSRQYVVRLVDHGALRATTTTGGHRRILLNDALAFQKSRDEKRRAALDELEDVTESYAGYAKLKK